MNILLCFAVALAGCLGEGEDRGASGRIHGEVLTIYSSLPGHGVSVPAARAVAAGQRQALIEAGGRAGDRRVRLVQLPSNEPGERLWDPDTVSRNAERAAEDRTAIAYLGELDYGGSAVSVPITNEQGLLQISALDGLTSLTRTPPGRPRSSPERLYPSGRRTFVRLAPADLGQAKALVALARAAGARRLGVVFDDRIHGRELAGQLVALGRRGGLLPVRSEEFRNDPLGVPELVRRLEVSRPDALVYAGVAGPASGRLLAELSRRLPDVPVLASAGLLVRDPRRPFPAAPETVKAVTPVLPASRLAPADRRTLSAVSRAAGVRAARPEALYGYRSVRLVLDALEAAGPRRASVAREALAARGRERDGALALYRLVGGRFELERVLR